VLTSLGSHPWAGVNVIGVFLELSEPISKSVGTVLGDLSDVGHYVENNSIDQVWIALPLEREKTVLDIVHNLRNTTVDVRYIPDLMGMQLINQSVSTIAGMSVINIASSPMVGLNRYLKALEDRLLACLALIVLSPLMVIIAIMVKLSSAGPVLYRQERMSWNGRSFTMLKFRTMPVDIEADGIQWGGSNKKQTTGFGYLLRRTSLDELPQLINVLLGDMSIVGPRPERTLYVEKFKDEIPGYMKKHMVKAGITGWAQVNGWRGDTDLHTRVQYDIFYIENWSLWFDMKIILLTLAKGMFSKHAY